LRYKFPFTRAKLHTSSAKRTKKKQKTSKPRNRSGKKKSAMANDKTVMAIIRAARPSFRNNHDKIAFAVHASFLASGYVLTATGPAAFSDTALSSPSTGTPLSLSLCVCVCV